MANGLSKNPSLHTDFKSVNLMQEKSAPTKVLEKKILSCQVKSPKKIGFFGKTSFGCIFY